MVRLRKRKEVADGELNRRKTLRQSLIEKNLNDACSDEIYRDQNKLIEDQIVSVQITKDDALLSKYNLQDIINFMIKKFTDLGITYQTSKLPQIRILLRSIFPNGLQWSYPGYLNTQISPIYQEIRDFGS